MKRVRIIFCYSLLISLLAALGIFCEEETPDNSDDQGTEITNLARDWSSHECAVPDMYTTDLLSYTEEEVVFDKPDGVELLAVMVQPEGDGPFPAMVVVHGGSWTSGDRYHKIGFCRHFAERGFLMMGIDYRLSPDTIYPDQEQDVTNAVKYLRGHAEEFNVDPDCIGILGASAGGHLAGITAYAYDQDWMDRECTECNNEDGTPRFLVSYYGVLALDKDPFIKAASFVQLGDDYMDIAELASPINYIDEKGIHIWFTICDEDPLVRSQYHADLMVEELELYERQYTYLPLECDVHGFMAGSGMSDLTLSTLTDEENGLYNFLEYALTN